MYKILNTSSHPPSNIRSCVHSFYCPLNDMLIRLSALEFPTGGGNFHLLGRCISVPSVLARSLNLCCRPSASSNSSASSGLLSAQSRPKNMTDIRFSGRVQLGTVKLLFGDDAMECEYPVDFMWYDPLISGLSASCESLVLRFSLGLLLRSRQYLVRSRNTARTSSTSSRTEIS